MNDYPSFKSLISLDTAIDHSSFSLAAKGLCVTPGAVGQQIQKLEEWLGTALLIQQTRQMLPAVEDLAYWLHIQPAGTLQDHQPQRHQQRRRHADSRVQPQRRQYL
ncbi:MAG: LysR family transcriptional regulator [Pseudomonas sp.]